MKLQIDKEPIMEQEEMLDDLAKRIQQMQNKAREKAQRHTPSMRLKRGFHAKGIGLRAKFQIKSEIPKELQVRLLSTGRGV